MESHLLQCHENQITSGSARRALNGFQSWHVCSKGKCPTFFLLFWPTHKKWWSCLLCACVRSCSCRPFKVSLLKPDPFDLSCSGALMHPLDPNACSLVPSATLFNISSCLLLGVRGWDWATTNRGASGSPHHLGTDKRPDLLKKNAKWPHAVGTCSCLPVLFATWSYRKCSRNAHCKLFVGQLSAYHPNQGRDVECCVNCETSKGTCPCSLMSICGLYQPTVTLTVSHRIAFLFSAVYKVIHC